MKKGQRVREMVVDMENEEEVNRLALRLTDAYSTPRPAGTPLQRGFPTTMP